MEENLSVAIGFSLGFLSGIRHFRGSLRRLSCIRDSCPDPSHVTHREAIHTRTRSTAALQADCRVSYRAATSELPNRCSQEAEQGPPPRAQAHADHTTLVLSGESGDDAILSVDDLAVGRAVQRPRRVRRHARLFGAVGGGTSIDRSLLQRSGEDSASMDAQTDHEARDRKQRSGSDSAQGSAQVETEQAPVEAQSEH